MQFKVPQNIDMQDRIIGPLTLGQFFYLLFGGLIIYILFNKLVLTGFSFLFYVLAFPIGIFSFMMAFVRIQDRPFPQFFFALIRYLTSPRQRVWQHQTATKAQESAEKTPGPKKNVQPDKKSLDPIRVRELAQILDNPTRDNG